MNPMMGGMGMANPMMGGMGMNPMMGGPMMGGMGMNPMMGGMGDMNMNGIPDSMEMGMNPMMGGMGMANPMMMNPCAPCIQCPLTTHDGGKCKAQLSDCAYNGFFGEMM